MADDRQDTEASRKWANKLFVFMCFALPTAVLGHGFIGMGVYRATNPLVLFVVLNF